MSMGDDDAPERLRFEGIGKRFHGIAVLRDVSLAVAPGRILGLVGENGAGKSTLMNILGGVHQPDSGVMLLDGRPHQPRDPREAARAGVAFIHQELNLFPNLSIAENLRIDGLPRRRVGGVTLPLVDRHRLLEESRTQLSAVGLDVPPTTPVARLSPGHQQLVEIARAIGGRARLLILDEPTSSLSAPEIGRLFGLLRRLRDSGVSMIFISHNLGDVLGLCDDLAVLRDGVLVSHGPREGYSRDRLILEMVGRQPDLATPRTRVASARSREPLLEADGLTRRPAFRDISFSIGPGEILGIAGLVGAGRTELARALFGLDGLEAGTVRFKGRAIVPSPRRCIGLGMAFLTEDRREDGLMMDASVADNAALVGLRSFARTPLRLIDRMAAWRAIRESLGDVRFRAVGSYRQAARTLSGGNQQKVVLAKWLISRPAVLIVDEPTRGIDVAAKHEVHSVIAALAAGGSGVLVISSEIEELTALCDRVLVMAAGRMRDEIARSEFDPERILRAAFAARDDEEPAT
ncbi:MAG: sugar ABC transporter ATP-binding protein [Isosphaeraceae bacterium]